MSTNYKFECDTLINSFSGSDKIQQNYSQAYQDLFALTMLSGKTSGKYIEIGANDPIISNNTYLLENQFNWKGISVEIDNHMVDKFNNTRKEKCYCEDATTFDWLLSFKNKRWKTKQIDYLSVDCEPSMTTYEALLNIPHDQYRFSVITFETEYYRGEIEAMDLQRSLLSDLGYKLVASNVCNMNNPFEDWWIDPKIVNESIWKPFESVNVEARSLFVK
jgi:hypothetical protein